MATKEITLSEASFVLGKPAGVINKAVDTGIVQAGVKSVGKRRIRTFQTSDLRFLDIDSQLKDHLTLTGRRVIYEAIRQLPPDVHLIKVGALMVDLTSADQKIKRQLDRLDRVRSFVSVEPTGEPVLRGTEIPVYVIAALVEGSSTDEVLTDYPTLTREQVEAAAEYAKAYPKRGRPYPGKSLKRMLAELDWPEEEDDDGNQETVTEPRQI